jgi:hypothetical protein
VRPGYAPIELLLEAPAGPQASQLVPIGGIDIVRSLRWDLVM